MSLDIYKMMAGVPPSTGGEFKLLYGNREKIGKASGLAVWVFDNTGSKLENISFSETLEDEEEGYTQNHAPMSGGEYKLLYGNRDKIKSASNRAGFVFGEINERPGIVGLVCSEVIQGSCRYGTEGCVSIGSYTIDGEDPGTYTYKWKVLSGNAEIHGDDWLPTIEVETISSKTDETFVLECMVIMDGQRQERLVETFTHTKIDATIIINSLTEIQAGVCDWETGYECTATSVYKVYATANVDLYEWTVDNGAEISAGQGTDVVSISTTSNTDDTFNVTCVCSNNADSKQITGAYMHDRTEVVVTPLVLNSIDELSSGSCVYPYQGECTITNGYQANVTGTPINSYEWTVVGATITGGAGTSIITVETTDNEDRTFSVECKIENSQYNTSKTEVFTHTRTEQVYDQIVINNIDEVTAGSCKYEAGSECIAFGEYKIDATGYSELEWSVVGGTIISGQGTDTVTIETPSGDSDIMFDLTCIAKNDKYSDSLTKQFTHTKTILTNEYDQSMTYDDTNIATEFIA